MNNWMEEIREYVFSKINCNACKSKMEFCDHHKKIHKEKFKICIKSFAKAFAKSGKPQIAKE